MFLFDFCLIFYAVIVFYFIVFVFVGVFLILFWYFFIKNLNFVLFFNLKLYICNARLIYIWLERHTTGWLYASSYFKGDI
jgi:hypothetical protein